MTMGGLAMNLHQPPLLPYGFSTPSNHYNYQLRLQFCIRLKIYLPRAGDIYSIRHQLIFPPSVSPLPSSSFCHLFQASSTFLWLARPFQTLWLDWIRFVPPFSSKFFDRLQTAPSFFKALQPSLTFRDPQWLSDSLNSLLFVPLPSSTFGLFSRLSPTFLKLLSAFFYLLRPSLTFEFNSI
jgi:hypothetical protein